MIRLDIPYRSQWDSDAQRFPADCGPTCVAMVLNFKQVAITPDGVYDFIQFYTNPNSDTQGRRGVTSVSELMKVLKDHQVPVEHRQFGGKMAALEGLRAMLDAGNPVIALVKYAPWRTPTGNQYDHGHFVVVTGYENGNVFMHDPLFGLWVRRSAGAHYTMSQEMFSAGWGGFVNGENPNWVCFLAGGTGMPSPAAVPTTTSTATSIPAPMPTPVPAAPTPPLSGETMDDVNRRIRALAAYRWAEAPDFNDPAAVQLWLNHLGDWGLRYDTYVVQPGDTLSRLAERFYGQSNRWYAIKAYNNLNRDGLWVGESLLIPLHGTTNAHQNPALPSDTTNFAKAIDLNDLIDPDLPAFDFNAVAGETAGIGFVE